MIDPAPVAKSFHAAGFFIYRRLRFSRYGSIDLT
jgi:hypothetical protein